MKKNVEEKSTSKNILFLVIIVLIISIVATLLSITIIVFTRSSVPNNKKVNSTTNLIQESFIEKENSNITSYEPDEKFEINELETPNTEMQTEEIIQESEHTNISSTPLDNNSNVNTNISNNSSNISNESNTSSTDEHTNPTISTTPPISEVTPYKTKTETLKELTKTEIKYGVIISTYTTSTYDLYSDGSKIVKSSYNTMEYDRTNYNATTSELLPEAGTARNQYSSWINQVFKNVNAYRQEANNNSVDNITSRSNLSLSEDLCVAACARAVEMAYSSKFSHTRPNGSKCYSILKEMNISYSTAGENIAYGYSSADSASEGWKNSAGHYSNMISPDFSKIGIGVFKLEETYYWVQLFN